MSKLTQLGHEALAAAPNTGVNTITGEGLAEALEGAQAVAVGICGPSAIARDFPAVTLPAILGTILTLWAVANARAERAVPART